MKKLLLTGAGGFVGSHTLVHFLHNTDWDLILTDSFRHKGLTDRIRQQIDVSHEEFRSRVKVITHDLVAPFSSLTVKEMGNVDYIINMASESHVDRSIEDPVPFVRNNIDLTLNMLELARKLEPEAFIQISTDEVYGPAPLGYSYVEWDTNIPSNPYSASKAAQESIAIAYWRTYGVPVIITNTMNMIGEMQDPEKYVPNTTYKILRGDKVQVHAEPTTGRIGSRFYLHARNQADALLFLLQNHPPVKFGGVVDRPDKYHIVGEQEVDNLELARMIADIMGYALHYELIDFHSSRPGHDLRYALSGEKIASMGWKPPVPFEESLRNTVLWTIDNQEWLDI